MNKTMKKFLTILCASCMATGAAMFVACDQGDVKDPALYAMYQEAKTDLTYEQWLKQMLNAAGSQGETGKGIKSVAMNDDGTAFIVTYTDDTTELVAIPQASVKEHIHTYGDVTVVMEPEGATEGFGYKTCTDDDCGDKSIVILKNYVEGISTIDSDGIYYVKFTVKSGELGNEASDIEIDIASSSAKKYTIKSLDEKCALSLDEESDAAASVSVDVSKGGEDRIIASIDTEDLTAGTYVCAIEVSSEALAIGTKENPYSYSYYDLFNKVTTIDAEGEVYFVLTGLNRVYTDFSFNFAEGTKITQVANYQGYYVTASYSASGIIARGGADASDEGYADDWEEPVYTDFVGELAAYNAELKSGATKVSLSKDYVTKYVIFKASAESGKVVFSVSEAKGTYTNPIALQFDKTYSGTGYDGLYYTYTTGATNEKIVVYNKAVLSTNTDGKTVKEMGYLNCYDDAHGGFWLDSACGIYTLTANTTYSIHAANGTKDGIFEFKISLCDENADYSGMAESTAIAITGDSYAPTTDVTGVRYYTYKASVTGRPAVTCTGTGSYIIETSTIWAEKDETITVTVYATDIYTLSVSVKELTAADSTVTVKDSTGAGVSGATVKVMNGESEIVSATTDADGKATLSFVPADGYSIIVTKDGYTQATSVKTKWYDWSADYDDGEDYSITMYSQITKKFVVKAGETVLSGITVKIGGVSATTDENGEATLTFMSGKKISVSLEGLAGGYSFEGKTLSDDDYAAEAIQLSVASSIAVTLDTQVDVALAYGATEYYTFTSTDGGTYTVTLNDETGCGLLKFGSSTLSRAYETYTATFTLEAGASITITASTSSWYATLGTNSYSFIITEETQQGGEESGSTTISNVLALGENTFDIDSMYTKLEMTFTATVGTYTIYFDSSDVQMFVPGYRVPRIEDAGKYTFELEDSITFTFQSLDGKSGFECTIVSGDGSDISFPVTSLTIGEDQLVAVKYDEDDEAYITYLGFDNDMYVTADYTITCTDANFKLGIYKCDDESLSYTTEWVTLTDGSYTFTAQYGYVTLVFANASGDAECSYSVTITAASTEAE